MTGLLALAIAIINAVYGEIRNPATPKLASSTVKQSTATGERASFDTRFALLRTNGE